MELLPVPLASEIAQLGLQHVDAHGRFIVQQVRQAARKPGGGQGDWTRRGESPLGYRRERRYCRSRTYAMQPTGPICMPSSPLWSGVADPRCTSGVIKVASIVHNYGSLRTYRL